MNNEHFRRLVQDTPVRSSSNGDRKFSSSTPRSGSTGGTTALGSRLKSSIPMTPRTVRGTQNIDFARQVAVQQREQQDQRQQSKKKFRSSAAPKGTKLAPGYRDRTQDRLNDGDEGSNADGPVTDGQETNAGDDDRARRVRALEESMKLGQIDRATFEKLRDDITDGDIRATHLVKGLDRRLLDRVRRGEDILSGNASGNSADTGTRHMTSQSPEDTVVNIEDEFSQLEQKEVVPVANEKTVKKGIMAPPPPPSVAGAKRSRNAILAQLKASRQSQAEFDSQTPTSAVDPQDDSKTEQPQLGSKFRRIGEKEETSRIERDERGREVLVIRDRNGKVIKRKVRKLNHANGQDGSGKRGAAQSDGRDEKGLLLPTNTAQPLGAEVSDLVSAAAAKKGATEGNTKEDEGDIFEGIGTDYDPLSPSDDENEHDNADDDDDDDDHHAVNGRNHSKDDSNNTSEIVSTSKHTENTNGEAKIRTDKDILTEEKIKESKSKETSSTAHRKPQPFRPRNYFATSSSSTASTDVISNLKADTDTTTTNPLSDPTLISALKKASVIQQTNNDGNHNISKTTSPLYSETSQSINNNTDKTQHSTLHDRLQARARAADRDLEDLDLGFGSSRFGDAEDMALEADAATGGNRKGRSKLAEWDGGGSRLGIGGGDGYGDDDHDVEDAGGTSGKKNKNSEKKKGKGKGKGDKNNVDDILGLAEKMRSER